MAINHSDGRSKNETVRWKNIIFLKTIEYEK